MTTQTEGRYRREGFVVIPDVFEDASVTACIEHLRGLQAEHPGAAIVTASLTKDGFLARLVGDSRLTNIARCLLAAEPVPFGCTYFVKEPHDGLSASWHQDGHPWQTRLGISEAVTLWLALDRSDETSGGLQVIPGSHRLAAQPLRPHGGQPSLFGYEIDPALVDSTRAQPVRLRPGDVSAHHPNLIHGSLPNRSEQLRRGLAVRYATRQILNGT
jgi:phytanoyl-CoA hydroxylase